MRFDVVSSVGYGLGALSRAVVELALLPRNVVRTLGRRSSADDSGQELLVRIVDSDPETRADAIQVIAELGTERASSLLAEGLVDPDAKVRAESAGAAADLGAINLVFDLVWRLKDSELEVRRAAKNAIERLSDEAIEFEPEGDVPTLEHEVETIRRWWSERRYLDLRWDEEDA
jgi:HEAT repeat protein